MKKFLSLALSLAMTLSLITVSAGAKEFPDGDKLSGDVYEEAVNVMSEMGIIDGYTDGEFKPQDTLTRGAASKIIACMMLGKTEAEKLGTSAAPFKDVPLGSTFAGYIAFCVESGIIDGYADGTFRPGNTLTGFAFQKMLLTALGYNSQVEKYVNNPNWRVNVGARAQTEGLLDGLGDDYKGSDPATREQAALMALNTIKTPLVEYTNVGGSLTVNGIPVGVSASDAKYVTTVDRSHATSIDDRQYQTSATGQTGSYFVEFGERYQPDLIRSKSSDDFGRPSYTWTWQKNEVGTYVDYSLLVSEYNTGVSGRDLRDTITQSAIDKVISDGRYSYYVDGVLSVPGTTQKIDHVILEDIDLKNDLVRGNSKDVGMTKNGVLTQVFLNRDTSDGKWELTITSIDTWLAKANADYNKNAEELSVTTYTEKRGTDETASKNLKIDVEDVPEIENVKKDDFILVRRSGKGSNSTNPVLNVVEIADPEILSDQTVTQFTKGDSGARAIDKLTTGGQEYNFSQKCYYDAEALEDYDRSLLTNMTYDVYLDEYGYVIGVSVHEGNRNYVFVAGYDFRNGNSTAIINRTATASAIFMDGSMQNITVNSEATDDNIETYLKREIASSGATNYYQEWNRTSEARHNRWYSYTTNAAGVYTLKPVERMMATDYSAASTTLNSANLSLQAVSAFSTPKTTAGSTRSYGNDDSVYITVKTERVTGSDSVYVISDVDGVYTGIQNVKMEVPNRTDFPEVYTLYDSDNYIIASIVVGEAQGSIDNYVYVSSDAKSERYEDGLYYWTFEGIQNGEKKTFTARSKYADTINKLDKYHVQQMIFDGEYVSKIQDIPNPKFYTDNTVNMESIKDLVDVYDVGHAQKPAGAGFYEDYCSDTQKGYDNRTSSRINGTIRFIGNTLYVANDNNRGLAVRPNAKAVLIQEFNNDRDVTEHNSVRDAIDSMRDANDGLSGMQFKGRIVAGLKDGVAQWVILISDTPLKTGDKTGVQGGGSIDDNITQDDTKNIIGSKQIKNPDNTASRLSNDSVVQYTANAQKGIDLTQDIIASVDRSGDVTIVIPTKSPYQLTDNYSVTVNGINRTGDFVRNGNRLQSSGLKLNAGDKVIVTLNEVTTDYNQSFTITLNANASDGKFASNNSTTRSTQTVQLKAVDLEEPTRPDYDFAGWYTERDCLNPFDASTLITAPITLYAGWTKRTTSAVPGETVSTSDGKANITIKGDAGKVDSFVLNQTKVDTTDGTPKVTLTPVEGKNVVDVPVYANVEIGGKTYTLKLKKAANQPDPNKIAFEGFDTEDPTYKDNINNAFTAQQLENALKADSKPTIVIGKPTISETPVTQTYSVTVTAPAATDGTLSADKTADLKAGDTVTLTVTPATGKKVTAVTVTDANNAKVEVTALTGENAGKWTFTMPAANVTVTATFEDDAPITTEYTITTATVENGTVTTTPADKAAAGTEVTVTPNADEGYEVDKVTIKVGDAAEQELTKGDNGYVFSLTGNTVVSATFKKTETPPVGEQYTVSFAAGEGATGTMDAVKVDKAETGDTKYALPECTFTAPTDKEFAGWLVGEETEVKAAGTEITLTADVTVTATWKDSENPPATKFTVTFNAGEGATVDPTTAETTDGKLTTLPTPTKADSTDEFGGWFDNEECTGEPVTADKVYTADTTLYAKWTPAGQQETAITSVTFAALPEKLTAGTTLPTTVAAITTDPANTATAAITWVDAETDVPATIAEAGHSYKATVTVTASDGYTLTDTAFKAGTADVNPDNVTVAEDGKTATLTATLAVDSEAPDTYTVTVTAPAETDGTLTADKETAAEGETVTLTVTPATGKKVTAVTVTDADGADVEVTALTGEDAGKWTFEMPAKDVTVSATFEDDTPIPEDINLTFAKATGTVLNKDLTTLGRFTVPAKADADNVLEIVAAGQVPYIEGWTEFSSDPAQQEGNYVALKVNKPEDADVTVTLGDKTLAFEDEDGTCEILILRANDHDTFALTATKGDVTKAYTIDLSGLTLAAPEQASIKSAVLLAPHLMKTWLETDGNVFTVGGTSNTGANLPKKTDITKGTITPVNDGDEVDVDYEIEWTYLKDGVKTVVEPTTPLEGNTKYTGTITVTGAAKSTLIASSTVDLKDTANGTDIATGEKSATGDTVTFTVEFTTPNDSATPVIDIATGMDATLQKDLGTLGTDLKIETTGTSASGVIQMKVSGTAKYVPGWTEFSSTTDYQNGHYLPLSIVLPSSAANGTVDVTNASVDKAPQSISQKDVLVMRLDDLVASGTDYLAISIVAGEKTTTYEVSFKDLVLEPTPAEEDPTITVPGATTDLFGSKRVSDLVSSITLTQEGNAYTAAGGTVNYVADFTGFDDTSAEGLIRRQGHYLPVQITLPMTKDPTTGKDTTTPIEVSKVVVKGKLARVWGADASVAGTGETYVGLVSGFFDAKSATSATNNQATLVMRLDDLTDNSFDITLTVNGTDRTYTINVPETLLAAGPTLGEVAVDTRSFIGEAATAAGEANNALKVTPSGTDTISVTFDEAKAMEVATATSGVANMAYQAELSKGTWLVGGVKIPAPEIEGMKAIGCKALGTADGTTYNIDWNQGDFGNFGWLVDSTWKTVLAAADTTSATPYLMAYPRLLKKTGSGDTTTWAPVTATDSLKAVKATWYYVAGDPANGDTAVTPDGTIPADAVAYEVTYTINAPTAQQ